MQQRSFSEKHPHIPTPTQPATIDSETQAKQLQLLEGTARLRAAEQRAREHRSTPLIDKAALPLGAPPKYGTKPTGATRPKPPYRRALYSVVALLAVIGGAAAVTFLR
ncbi:hypothetical protein [Roseateles sp.]|uniref:hypothetical protein n=1 Tax=Roseateles sp. TaxID=1971397 RepID=UPI0031DBA31C